ncbi:MAG TPA: DMT family transporter [Chthoniobacterales bacterium]|nr:DMT family transporter [Chthoniobacterales bacterium]
MRARLLFLTFFAMIAFASNSLLCRAALKETGIDAASFTFIRIFSGAAALWLIMRMRSPRSSLVTRHSSLRNGNWLSAFALFAYAAAFSFAYNTLSAGTGALVLFGAVQATMILWGFRKGERLRAIQVIGLLVAVIGLVVLVFPGLSAPPLIGSMLMLSAGIAWGVYSLRGKVKGQSGSDRDALASTAGNFLRAVPFAALVSVIMLPKMHLDSVGVTYAVISGAITSGLGYVIWYAALAGLKAASAATVQLSVPVLAATGGILLLGEPITLRYLVASVAVLGGIALVVTNPIWQTSGTEDQQ